MKSIALFLGSFSTNGVARITMTLAEAFVEMGYSIDFVVSHNDGPIKKEVPKGCKVFEIGSSRPRDIVKGIGKYLKAEKPDGMIVPSWPNTASAIIAKMLYMPSLKLIVSEHSHFREAPELSKKDRFLLKYFSRWIYKMSSQVIAVSEGTKQGLNEVTGLSMSNIQVIYNPLRAMPPSDFLAEEHELSTWWNKSKKILAVGRLEKAKDFKTLIKAFSNVVNKEDAKLIILGEGSCKDELQELIDELKLSDRVRLPGFTSNLYPYYKNADLFVLSSYNEGFGNVIIEAMSVGTPVVSTDCLSGPAEILENGKWGKLVKVGSNEELSSAIVNSLKESHDEKELIGRANEFLPKFIAEKYLNLLFKERRK